MSVVKFNNQQWEKILALLTTCQNIYIGQENDCRNFLEAVFWITRSGSQWRLLPPSYGNWNSIYKRFARWSEAGLQRKTLRAFRWRPRFRILVDWLDHRPRSRLCRRREKKHGEQSLGKSRGGHSTKIHLATDAKGYAIRFILTGGQRNDITQAEALVEELTAE